MLIKTLSIILLFVTIVCHSQTPRQSGDYEFERDVDSSAEYPGGLPAFYEYIKSIMVYPSVARANGIEGMTFVQFVVNSSGHIIVNSVKTIKGLHPLCDVEAVRVVKACTTRWKPAMKNGKMVNQQFVLPIAFKLTDGTLDSWHPIENPIKTVVIPKTFKSGDSLAWTLYHDAQMKTTSGRIPVGDSVQVKGWAPWAYFIETGSVTGYISWKALKATDELKPLLSIIAERSPIEELEIEKLDILELTDTANAFLSITANKNSIHVGECVTLTLGFNVANDNRVPMQFYDLSSQMSTIVPRLTLENCWIVNANIADIQGIPSRFNGIKYTTYPIYKAAYCPVAAGNLALPSTTLAIAKVRHVAKVFDSLLTFTSTPISVKVSALPPDMAPTAFDGYGLVGNFELADSLHSKNVSVGEPVTYVVAIRGKGLAYPIQPPKIEMENVQSHLLDIVDTDTLIEDQLRSSKTFVYQLIFQKAGSYDFNGEISLSVFDPITKKIRKLISTNKVTVSAEVKRQTVITPNIFGSKRNFIAIDASKSMAVEDYKPHRLGAVKTGLKKFLMSKETCDIGLILFGGNAKHFTLATPNKCYTERFIDSIDFNLNISGTAIGDAIWLANNSYADKGPPKKLVIIGDGDNTAGHLSPKFAATMAKKYNVKIYAIGVGTSGQVPYGRDADGRPYLIENTFTDKDLKIICSITNGQYFWAKDAQDVNRILGIIFSSP